MGSQAYLPHPHQEIHFKATNQRINGPINACHWWTIPKTRRINGCRRWRSLGSCSSLDHFVPFLFLCLNSYFINFSLSGGARAIAHAIVCKNDSLKLCLNSWSFPFYGWQGILWMSWDALRAYPTRLKCDGPPFRVPNPQPSTILLDHWRWSWLLINLERSPQS